jgi:isochorismate synthase
VSTEHVAHWQWIERAKRSIQAGDLEKVVVSRVLHTDMEQQALADLFIQGCEQRPDAFAALVHTPEHGTWCGLSPELLVEALDDSVTSDALAGTVPVPEAPLTAGAWGRKERSEQRVVVEHIAQVFSDLGLGGVVIHPTDVVTAGNVAHLRTRITGELGDRTLSELVLALHPTPAVCGASVAAAREFILANETHERRLYTGAWGPWNPDGHTRLFVNIRCLQHADGGADLFVGGGITSESDPAAEWEETEAKAQTLLEPIAALTKAG